jgi:hypothetical protein
VQRYFLETVPPPGKITAINLIPEDTPITSNPSELQSLLEDIAIPEHGRTPLIHVRYLLLMGEVLVPLQEYFLNRRTNPKDYPKYVGIRIMQEDASLYDNVLECCPRGCAHVVAKDAVSEGRAEESSRQPLAEKTFEHNSESHGEDGSASVEPPFDTYPNIGLIMMREKMSIPLRTVRNPGFGS